METTRRELLTCAAAWAGAGIVWSLSSGILSSRALADARTAITRSAQSAPPPPPCRLSAM